MPRYAGVTIRRLAVFSTLAFTLSSASLVDPVNKNRQGTALKGYDPVAYFRAGGPMKGSPQFTYFWIGANWQFSSGDNRDEFIKQPEKYAPQFGGYCAWAVSNNYTADADPEAWRIIDGKLYVNYNKDVQKKWEQDVLKRIDAASQNWPKLHK